MRRAEFLRRIAVVMDAVAAESTTDKHSVCFGNPKLRMMILVALTRTCSRGCSRRMHLLVLLHHWSPVYTAAAAAACTEAAMCTSRRSPYALVPKHARLRPGGLPFGRLREFEANVAIANFRFRITGRLGLAFTRIPLQGRINAASPSHSVK